MPCAFTLKRSHPGLGEATGCQFDESEGKLIGFEGKKWCRFHLPVGSGDTQARSAKAEWSEAEIKVFNERVFKFIEEARAAGKTADLSGVVFPGPVLFIEFRARNRALPAISFQDATFIGAAGFGEATFSDHTEFAGTTFSAGAHFERAVFGGYTNFGGANFTGVANFHKAEFGRDVHFAETIFDDNAMFAEATFKSDADFRQAAFGGETEFTGTRFSSGGGFEKAVFGRHTKFTGAIFERDTVFHKAAFNGPADFGKARFAGEVSFVGTTFSGLAEFEGAFFSGDARFVGAFFNGALFGGARFSGTTNFHKAAFDGNADFEVATFSDDAGFEEATFMGSAFFGGAAFGSDADFMEAIFDRYADFSAHAGDSTKRDGKANVLADAFPRAALFRGAHFRGPARFVNRRFLTKTDFAEATFEVAPEFHGCTLHQDTSFRDARFLDRVGKAGVDAVRAYRTLRLAMEQTRARSEQAMFYALEQAALRNSGRIRGWDALLSRLYEITSDYGRNSLAPLFWLAWSWGAFFLVYLMFLTGLYGLVVTPDAFWDIVRFTTMQIVRPFDALLPLAGAAKPPFPVTFWLGLVAAVQSVVSLGLLAVFFLALRWRFKRD